MKTIFIAIGFLSAFFCGCRKTGNNPLPGSTNNPPPGPAVQSSIPVANAGPDTTIQFPADFVDLNGAQSTATPPFRISWRDLATNNFSGFWFNTNIVGETTYRPRVWLPAPGIYRFELTVSNAAGIARDTVEVNVLDFPFCTGNRAQVNAQLTAIADIDIPASPENSSEVAAAGNKLLIAQRQHYRYPEPIFNSRPVQIFDLSSRSWSAVQLSQPRGGMAIISAGDKVFFAGGATSVTAPNTNTFFTTVDVYQASTNTWSTTQLSEARAFCKAALVGNKVVFAGGLKQDFTLSSRVDIYDLTTNTWSTTFLPSGGRLIHAAVGTSNKVYFCGGFSEFSTLDNGWYDFYNPVPTVNVYDVTTGQWATQTMQATRTGFAALALNNRVYLAGGRYGSGMTHHVEAFDAASNTRTDHCLNRPTLYHDGEQSAAARNGQAVFFLGEAATINTFDIYNSSNNTWSIGKLMNGFVTPSYGIASKIVSVNNVLYVVNGNKLYRLDF